MTRVPPSRRLERAAALLRTTDWTVARICTAAGLTSVGSFTTSFRRMFGSTPSRRSAGGQPESEAHRVVAVQGDREPDRLQGLEKLSVLLGDRAGEVRGPRQVDVGQGLGV